MKERIQKLITKWRGRAEWAHAKMDVAIRTIDKAAYESVWLESARISDDLESLLNESEPPLPSKEEWVHPTWEPALPPPTPPPVKCRVCGGSGFVAEKRFIDDGYGEIDSCPACTGLIEGS